MNTTQTIYFLLSGLVGMLPQFVVIIGGIFLCFSKMSKFPKASKLALIGLGVLFATLLFGIGLSFLQLQLPFWYRDSYVMIGYINFGVGLLRNIIWSAGLAVIIYAVWTGRDEKGIVK